MIRTISQIERDIREAEAMASSDLKPQKGLSGDARRSLYSHRVKALKVELKQAQARAEAMRSLGGSARA